jgi:hypothetical protein
LLQRNRDLAASLVERLFISWQDALGINNCADLAIVTLLNRKRPPERQ